MRGARHLYETAQLRSGWRGRLALVAALGLVGALALGSALGAMRTSSAVDRFLADQRAFGALVFCGPPEPTPHGYACEETLGGLDEVSDTASLLTLPGMLSAGGVTLEVTDDTCYSGSGDVGLVVAPDSRYGTAVNTHRFIAGRPADPTRADEVVIGRELARRAHLGLGDTVDVQLFGGADCLATAAEWHSPRALTVVGIQVSPSEVRPESGDYLAFVYGTPALLAEVGPLPDSELMVAVRLRSGSDSMASLRASLADLGVPSGAAMAGTINSDNLKRSARPYVTAQWLVGGLIAAAGVVLLGQALGRQIRAGSGELRALAQLGLTRRDLLAIGLTHVLSVVIPAAVLGALGAYLTSSFTPLGVARVVDGQAGLRADVVPLTLGIGVMILALIAAALPSVIAAGRQRPETAVSGAGRAGALARQLGGGPVSTTGLRMAFEPVRGPAAPPLRTGVGVILCAAILLVASTVFAGSLTHLLSSPHLVGWNWDGILTVEGDGDEPVDTGAFLAAAAAAPGVEAVTAGTIWPPMSALFGPDRVELQIFSLTPGAIEPTLISGRAARGSQEIVLGPETMERLDYHEGDEVPFVAVTGEWEEVSEGRGTETMGTVTIVGTGVIPGSGGDSRLGTGGAVDFEFYRAYVPEAEPGVVFVRFAAGADRSEATRLMASSLSVDRVDLITDEILGDSFLDLAQVRNLPIAVAAMLALLAVGVVAQVIVGSTHARRSELGVLRALGLRPRQIRMAIVVQAMAVSGAVLIVGLPVGIAAGRQIWTTFALSLGTKPEIDVAARWLAVLVISLVALASLFGLLGSIQGRRRVAAAALHRE